MLRAPVSCEGFRCKTQKIKIMTKDSIKLANDAASIVTCAFSDHMSGNLDYNAFKTALYNNFPQQVANHIEYIVGKALEKAGTSKESHIAKWNAVEE
jgi:hypothetical protein